MTCTDFPNVRMVGLVGHDRLEAQIAVRDGELRLIIWRPRDVRYRSGWGALVLINVHGSCRTAFDERCGLHVREILLINVYGIILQDAVFHVLLI